jgi:hypothetical protein
MRRTAAAIIVAMTTFSAAVPAAEAGDAVDAVTIQGSGELMICRSWVVYTSCATHKVHLPERVAVGDVIALNYGSNPKSYAFRIAVIHRDGNGCMILSEDTTAEDSSNRIAVARCSPVSQEPAEAR